MGVMVASSVFYLLFGLYLDQVFPNEFGKKKHPLFFLFCLKRETGQ
jgi:ATP-binding cassette subfamily A (ABC1) protein 3